MDWQKQVWRERLKEDHSTVSHGAMMENWSTYKEVHTLLSSTLWQTLPTVRNLILDLLFSVHFRAEWEKRMFGLLFFFFFIIVHIAPIFWTLHSWCRWDWKSRPFLVMPGSHSVLPLYLSVCSTHGCTLTRFLKGLDRLSVKGLCIQKSCGSEKSNITVDSRALIGVQI